MPTQKISILGSGITAASVTKYAQKNNISIVPPDQADLVIASPGLPPHTFPKVTAPIISEIEWAYRLFQESHSPPTLIAITGTNGKSTATAMIAHICDCPYAGNIGIPLIDYVGLEHEFPIIAVEVSSYQLETCTSFRPNISVFLNITPDHLSRHGSLENYLAEKTKCCSNQQPSDYVVYYAQDRLVETCIQECLAETVPFDNTDINRYLINTSSFLGTHNKLNAVAALKVAECLGLSIPSCANHLKHFKPLKHRLELVGDQNNIKIYNDSKSTNPESTIKALEAFLEPTLLICCGENKNLSLNDLANSIVKHSKSLIIFGDISLPLIHAITNIDPVFDIQHVLTIQEAVSAAITLATPGDIILFSPSSSSLDQFKNFEERGNIFCETVNTHV
ncbi:UDP-N-acetylmuramoyl-L-alanine--D-glutamate ligase [bacterium]|nr:UDP-N-acetylmuramoyl-L-alanine--D-glutamate ligase [bacterium]